MMACSRRSVFIPTTRPRQDRADWARVVDLATLPRVVAIGETGLDRYWKHTPFSQQQEWFDRHLALAHDLGAFRRDPLP